MNELAISEPTSKITAALVERVSERVGSGVPLSLAIAGEPVTCAEYEEHLRRNPELAVQQGVARRKFFQNILKMLLNAKEPSANARWLLDRLYSDVLDRQQQPGSASVAVYVPTVAGMTEEELQAFREAASRL
jgi:hypothetical protein